MLSPLPGAIEPELPTYSIGTPAIAAPSSLSYAATALSSASENSHTTSGSSDMEVSSVTSRK